MPKLPGINHLDALWRFLRLIDATAAVDAVEYPIYSPRKIFGILTAIALGQLAI